MDFRKPLGLADDGLAMLAALESVLPLANAFAPSRSKFMSGEGAMDAVDSPQQILADRFFIEDAARSGEES
jgi:hypothetical protein